MGQADVGNPRGQVMGKARFSTARSCWGHSEITNADPDSHSTQSSRQTHSQILVGGDRLLPGELPAELPAEVGATGRREVLPACRTKSVSAVQGLGAPMTAKPIGSALFGSRTPHHRGPSTSRHDAFVMLTKTLGR